MKGKGFLLLFGMIGGPIAAGFIDPGLQIFLIGVDVGIIGTFTYIIASLYIKMKQLSKAMEGGIDAMKKALGEEKDEK